jgi:nucleoside phosphorylase
MWSRSLRVSPEKAQLVIEAFQRTAFSSQQGLATELGFSRSTVSNFFNGKAVDRLIFIEISEKLGLNWQTIVDIKATENKTSMPDCKLKERYPDFPVAVILTAIPVEFQAVRDHLTDIEEETHNSGTIYTLGNFTDNGESWGVALAQIGAGNSNAAAETTRAIEYFKPNVVLFVGVAGGIKDVKIGDVVAATKVYGYESSKEEQEGSKSRPNAILADNPLQQRARTEATKKDWLQRIKGTLQQTPPNVHVGPIGAGDKLWASSNSAIFQQFRSIYNDAIAVEMEGHGFLTATHSYKEVDALIIRGISDLLDGKSEADAAGSQEIAASHASAFAFEILSKFNLGDPSPKLNIDTLVREVREKVKPSIQDWCGKIKVLDMNYERKLTDIYINVNILEKLTRERRIGIEELRQSVDPDNLAYMSLGKVSEPRVDALKAVNDHSKLMVWGKPGAGKTTFLKYLAIQCIEGKIQENRVPIFIEIERIAEIDKEANFLNFITKMLSNCGVTDIQTSDLLRQGRMFILFDGLDEVKDEDSHRILKQIEFFLKDFNKNHFVLTCRNAGQDYSPDFTEVEVADFDDEQIKNFSNNWFQARNGNNKKAENFLKKLKEDKPTKELANNPLLLTLLCLVFEERNDFPSKRFELYREAVDILISKWDGKREKERRKIYKQLELSGRKGLLSYIAYNTFERGEYFFTLRDLKEHIANYISNLPDAKTERSDLLSDSQDVVDSIESQHGLLVRRAKEVYSFSHVTFHEYFTARKITFSSSSPRGIEKTFESLASHITERRYREVFLRVAERVDIADYSMKLIKSQIDRIVAQDKTLQNFLKWVNTQSSLFTHTPYEQAAIRAFYLDVDIDIDVDRKLGCLIEFSCTCVFACASFLTRVLDQELSKTLKIAERELGPDLSHEHKVDNSELDLAIALERVVAIDILERDFAHKLDSELSKKLQQLKSKLPNRNTDEENFIQWWKANGRDWADQIRVMIVSPYKIDKEQHFQNFSNEQKKLLKEYYDANLLLMECLKGATISKEVLLHIKKTLLLPIDEIEQLT